MVKFIQGLADFLGFLADSLKPFKGCCNCKCKGDK